LLYNFKKGRTLPLKRKKKIKEGENEKKRGGENSTN